MLNAGLAIAEVGLAMLALFSAWESADEPATSAVGFLFGLVLVISALERVWRA